MCPWGVVKCTRPKGFNDEAKNAFTHVDKAIREADNTIRDADKRGRKTERKVGGAVNDTLP